MSGSIVVDSIDTGALRMLGSVCGKKIHNNQLTKCSTAKADIRVRIRVKIRAVIIVEWASKQNEIRGMPVGLGVLKRAFPLESCLLKSSL